MNTKIVLDTRSKTPTTGECPVKFYVPFGKFYLTSGIRVKESEFNNGIIVNRSDFRRLNSELTSKKVIYDNKLLNLELQEKLKSHTTETLKNFLLGIDEKQDKPKNLFINIYENYTNNITNKKYISTFDGAKKKISEFTDIDLIDIKDITVAWLKDFDIFMTKQNLATNTRAIYFRNIRTVYNDAIDRDIVSQNDYPFRRFKIKHADTAHRNISIEDMRSLVNFDCEKWQKENYQDAKKHTSSKTDLAKYRDLFMLSFYFCGLNMKDLLFLQPEDIRNGQLSILREKTGIPIVIKVEPEAQEIIDKYRGKKYLLNFLDTYKTDDYTNFVKRMNDNLKLILPYISVYWARHSWATLAAELDVSDQIIDIAMGHKIKGMASIYIARNLNKVSSANRKVIDYLHNKIEIEVKK